MEKIKNSLFIIMFIASVTIASIVGAVGIKKYKVYSSFYNEVLGKRIILNGDVLMIIDYSIMDKSVSLDNGMKIHTDLLYKLEYIKE